MENEPRHSIAVVADGPTCMGFRLAGVEHIYPIEALAAAGENKSAQFAAEQKVEQLLTDEHVGIMIINEKTLGQMDWRLKKKIEKAARPVVIAIPDKSGPMAQEGESLRSMVKRALGFELMK